MNSVHIHIHRLGGIKDAHIKLSPVMLFLGESGLGKSYVAMLCHYIYEFLLSPQRLSRFFESKGWDFNQMKPSLKSRGTAISINIDELESWIAEDAVNYLRNMLDYSDLQGEISIKLPKKENEEVLNINYEEVIEGIENEEEVYINLHLDLLRYRVKDFGLGEESPFAYLLRHALADRIFGDYRRIGGSYVLPPARAIGTTEKVQPTTGLYGRFIEWLDMRPYKPEQDKRYRILDKVIAKVIDGKIKRQPDGRFTYKMEEGGEIPVSSSAASVRELAPLAYLVGRRDMHPSSLLFEEPEAHLHPFKQRKMADVISALKSVGTHMQITTHSDYFLRRINELISLGRIKQSYIEREGEERGLELFAKVCADKGVDADVALSTEDLSAYYFCKEKSGTKITEEVDFAEGLSFKTFFDVLSEDMNKSQIIGDWLQTLEENVEDDNSPTNEFSL